MKLMLRSYSNLLLAVRRVTQSNQGKQTAGIDAQKVLTPENRVKLVRYADDFIITAETKEPSLEG